MPGEFGTYPGRTAFAGSPISAGRRGSDQVRRSLAPAVRQPVVGGGLGRVAARAKPQAAGRSRYPPLARNRVSRGGAQHRPARGRKLRNRKPLAGLG